jgi:hypothetical protein
MNTAPWPSQFSLKFFLVFTHIDSALLENVEVKLMLLLYERMLYSF